VIYDASLDDLLQRVWDGQRIVLAEALRLYGLPLEELGALADRRRHLAKAPAYEGRGNDIVTYIVDRNVNYTNVCTTQCRFCAFYRDAGHPDAYLLDYAVILGKVRELVAHGGTQLLMQGGLHPDLKIDWFEKLFRAIRTQFPGVQIHSLSPAEICHIAKLSGLSMAECLARLHAAGLQSLPGGGAEILVDAVRSEVSPNKIGWQEWAAVMRAAHALGMPTTATMMFGLGETLEHRIEHLDRVYQLQQNTHGFVAFIPWTLQPDNTKIGHKIPDRRSAEEYLRWLAIARIYLDSVPNIQVSWLTQGIEVGGRGLHFGANDLGSIMIEENVVSAAGIDFIMAEPVIRAIIEDAGFEARRRYQDYTLAQPEDDGCPCCTWRMPVAALTARENAQ